MKTAQLPESRQPIVASGSAPEEARCPHCDGVVTLRHRARMNGDHTYYWRSRPAPS